MITDADRVEAMSLELAAQSHRIASLEAENKRLREALEAYVEARRVWRTSSWEAMSQAMTRADKLAQQALGGEW